MLCRRRWEYTGGEERKMCVRSNGKMYEGEGTSGCCMLGTIIQNYVFPLGSMLRIRKAE